MPLYRGMDRAALDAAYNNGKAVASWPTIKADWEARSRTLLVERPGRFDVAYGAGPRQRLDWLQGEGADAPILVFVHGGYWQWNDKETTAFVAEGALARGLQVVLVEYTLAPAARIGAIIDEIGLALDHIEAAHPGAPIVLVGHSAGGHLIEHHRARRSVALAMPISGLFDLEPIALSFINAPLKLTPDEIAAYSPLRQLKPGAPLLLTVGDDELPELRRQTADYAAAIGMTGQDVSLLAAPGRDHFTILEDLAAPDGPLLAAILDRLGRA